MPLPTFDPYADLAYSTVVTAPVPATTGTSLTITTGDHTKFPATFSYNLVCFPAGTTPSLATAEIVRVTGISGDTLTILRAQESTTAQAISAGWSVALVPTAKAFTDTQGAIVANVTSASAHNPATHAIAFNPNLSGSQIMAYDNRNQAQIAGSPFASTDLALAALCTAIGSSNQASIVLCATAGTAHQIAATPTQQPTSNIFVHAEAGAQLNIASGATLDLSASAGFDAPPVQVFTGTVGNVKLPPSHRYFQEWFGASTNKTDNTAALTAAFAAAWATSTPIQALAGGYKCASQPTIPVTATDGLAHVLKIVGTGASDQNNSSGATPGTQYIMTSAATNLFQWAPSGGVDGTYDFEDFAVIGPDTTTSTTSGNGINMVGTGGDTRLILKNITALNFGGGYGVHAETFENGGIERVHAFYCGTGIQLGGATGDANSNRISGLLGQYCHVIGIVLQNMMTATIDQAVAQSNDVLGTQISGLISTSIRGLHLENNNTTSASGISTGGLDINGSVYAANQHVKIESFSLGDTAETFQMNGASGKSNVDVEIVKGQMSGTPLIKINDGFTVGLKVLESFPYSSITFPTTGPVLSEYRGNSQFSAVGIAPTYNTRTSTLTTDTILPTDHTVYLNPSAAGTYTLPQGTLLYAGKHYRIVNISAFPCTVQVLSGHSNVIASKDGTVTSAILYSQYNTLELEADGNLTFHITNGVSALQFARGVSLALADVTNVRAPVFGATGGGTVDDHAAIAASDAVTSGSDLYFPAGTYKVSSNLSLVSPVHFAKGALLAPDSGVTVTINNLRPPGEMVCFGGAGTVVLAAGAVVDASPTWWGNTDYGASINACLAAINGNPGASPNSNTFEPTAALRLPAGALPVATGFIAESWMGLHFSGHGPGQTKLQWTNATPGVLADFNGLSGCYVGGFSVEGGDPVTNAIQYRNDNDAGGHLPARSTTQNILDMISVYSQEFVVGLAIQPADGNNQCDGTSYRKIRINGGWNQSGSSPSGYYAAAIAMGAVPPNHGVAGDTYNHSFYDCCVTSCQWGVYADGCTFWWFGGETADCGIGPAPTLAQFTVTPSSTGGTIPNGTYYVYAIYEYGTSFYGNYTLIGTEVLTGSGTSSLSVVWATGPLPAACTNVTIAMLTTALPSFGTTPWIQGTLTAPGTLPITAYANSTQVTMAAGATFGIGTTTNSTSLISGLVDQNSLRFLQRIPGTGGTLTMQVSIRDCNWSNVIGMAWDNYVICCNAWCGDLFVQNFRIGGGASEPTAACILFEGEASPYTATIHLDGIQAQTPANGILTIANNADADWGTFKQLSSSGIPRSDTGNIFAPRNNGVVSFGSGGATADYQHRTYKCTASGTLTLPPSSGCPTGAQYECLVQVTAASQTATVQRSGSDTVQPPGAASGTSVSVTTFARFVLIGGTTVWLQC